MMVEQQQYYDGNAYYDLRPGITGLWQISDRNDCDFVGRVAYDEAYARTVSIKTDLETLQQTVGVVLRATGH
jgi:lipopolysaccharide/colanic/teichoic acid biosynthesis glycosyltransferase